jgi:hypothetical protein
VQPSNNNSNRQRLARISGWALVIISLPWGLWWCFDIPTPGKGGILLALVATFMPLVWEDVQPIGRAALIFTLVVLFGVEYRAIDKEHKDYAEEQRLARKEERESFQSLLAKQEASVNQILDQEDQHFKETLGDFLKQDKRENTRFGSLLGEQKSLFGRQNEMIESLNGHLLPGDSPLPSLAERGCEGMETDANDYFIVMKSATSWFHDFPHVVLSIKGRNMITVSKSSDGLLVVSMDIRTDKNILIARFDEQGFEVSPALNRRHPDKSTIIVEDRYGNELVKVRYVNPRALSIETRMTIDGRSVDVPQGGMANHGCFGHSRVDVDYRGR